MYYVQLHKDFHVYILPPDNNHIDKYINMVYPFWYYGHLHVQDKNLLKDFVASKPYSHANQPSFHQPKLKVILYIHNTTKYQFLISKSNNPLWTTWNTN
jgi:hypothetical protein